MQKIDYSMRAHHHTHRAKLSIREIHE